MGTLGQRKCGTLGKKGDIWLKINVGHLVKENTEHMEKKWTKLEKENLGQ